MFETDPGLMIWTVISFVILLVLLAKFAYKPLLGVMEQRDKEIRSSIEESQNTRKDAEKLLENYRRQLATAQAESKNIIAEGRTVAENVRKEVIEKAGEEANQILKQAKDQIHREKERAIMELQGSVAELSAMMASKVIEKTLSQEDHLKIIEEYLPKLEGYYGEG